MTGGPGAGKGTICTKLAQELGLEHVCVGDLLRAEIERYENDCPTLKPVKQAMDDGRLAPIGAIGMVLMDKLCETKQAVVLLDGFPRSPEQMKMFQRYVSCLHQASLILFNLGCKSRRNC